MIAFPYLHHTVALCYGLIAGTSTAGAMDAQRLAPCRKNAYNHMDDNANNHMMAMTIACVRQPLACGPMRRCRLWLIKNVSDSPSPVALGVLDVRVRGL